MDTPEAAVEEDTQHQLHHHHHHPHHHQHQLQHQPHQAEADTLNKQVVVLLIHPASDSRASSTRHNLRIIIMIIQIISNDVLCYCCEDENCSFSKFSKRSVLVLSSHFSPSPSFHLFDALHRAKTMFPCVLYINVSEGVRLFSNAMHEIQGGD